MNVQAARGKEGYVQQEKVQGGGWTCRGVQVCLQKRRWQATWCAGSGGGGTSNNFCCQSQSLCSYPSTIPLHLSTFPLHHSTSPLHLSTSPHPLHFMLLCSPFPFGLFVQCTFGSAFIQIKHKATTHFYFPLSCPFPPLPLPLAPLTLLLFISFTYFLQQ